MLQAAVMKLQTKLTAINLVFKKYPWEKKKEQLDDFLKYLWFVSPFVQFIWADWNTFLVDVIWHCSTFGVNLGWKFFSF